MSVEHTLYVGPYVECKHGYMDEPYDVTACPNTQCARYYHRTKDEFCPDCGTKTKEVTQINRVDDVDPEKYMDLLLMVCCEYVELKDHHIYTMPMCDGYDAKGLLRRQITPEEITKALDKTREKNKDLLASLEEDYKEVRLCWGIILDVS